MRNYIHKVHYYETDKMGITHHSNYIRFLEEARMHFLSELGWPMTRLETAGITSPVVSVNCDYRKTTTYDDRIEIGVRVKQYSGVRLTLSYVLKNAATEEPVATATSVHCFLNRHGVPIALKKYFPDFDIAIKNALCEGGER